MNDVKLAVLGGEGTGKSALTVRFLTKRFIGEYASNFESIYSKHLYLEGKQLNLEIYDPCSQPKKAKFSLTSELHWADGFVIVYDISDRSSFAFAKALVYRIREPQTSHCKSCVLHFRAVESAVLLVGNKQDLCHVREVGWEEGQKLALDNRCQFCELSAAEQCLERETECEQGKSGERGRQNLKQAPGSELSAQSPTWGSNSQTARS
ncbi:ras-related and estrogen-regulated growth inhibitor-like protein isoform X2 [Neofelis nebulosa]|uniref:ras-related and estrogen-regulated growth inhibitor-like protein isoform X2 n=1 Tax=Neofelis nebulosa TaxID=61452 RepID=UPI00272C9876|nr:ras-related and estrogen-regulated growth inhibitor-like protein isoform X2 [Neofelis nebulosa]